MNTGNVAQLFATDAHNPSFAEVCEFMPTACKPIDFCVPVNRYFPPAALLEEIREALPDIVKYYPDYAATHQKALSNFTGLPMESLVVANGSTELITLLCQHAEGPFATDIPTFGRWSDLLQHREMPTHFIQRRREQGFTVEVEQIVEQVRRLSVRTLVLCNPNNPTGVAFADGEIALLVQDLADLDLIVIDESFIDFSDAESAMRLAIRTPNLVVVKSLGKSLGWHGIRIGYAVAEAGTAERLRSRVPFWNVNGLAAFVLARIVTMRDEFERSLARVCEDRDVLVKSLSAIEQLDVYPSQANFVFVGLPCTDVGRDLRDTLLTDHGLLVRTCGNKLGSSDSYMRLAVNRPVENARLLTNLRTYFDR